MTHHRSVGMAGCQPPAADTAAVGAHIGDEEVSSRHGSQIIVGLLLSEASTDGGNRL